MPRVRITELLNEVARRTGFAHAFTDLRSGKPVENVTALIAAILADGSNLGLERMANASQGVTKAQLEWVHTWYLRGETTRRRSSDCRRPPRRAHGDDLGRR